MSAAFGDDPDRQHFAALLRSMREAKGWSREELGAKTAFVADTIKSFELGKRPVTAYHAQKFDKVFGTAAYKLFEVEAERFGHEAGYSATMEMFLEAESGADELYWFEHSLIPGLLQTEAYAREVLATWPNVTPAEVDRLVEARLARQDVIQRSDRKPPYLWALVDEGVLHRPVAPADVLREQFSYLVEVSHLANVSVSVVPYKAKGHTGLLGAFVIAERRNEGTILYKEDIADGQVTDDPATVADVALRFKSLQLEALPSGDSRDLIARMAEEL
jgi:transcriptional regulator with XRE-family HTH domain